MRAKASGENRVDLLVGIRGFDPQAFARAIDVPFEGESLRFVGLEDFGTMKLFAGGPHHLNDANSALQVAVDSLDTDLLRNLASRYGTATAQSLDRILTALDRDLDSGLELD
jgi:hypothetical protein